MAVILSIDIGSGSLKAGLVDAQTGRWIGTASRAIATTLKEDRAEQSADEYWTALLSAIDELRDIHPASVAYVNSVGVTGQMRGFVLVGPDAEPIGPVLTLSDRRAKTEADEFLREFGIDRIHLWTGQRFDLASVPAKFRWLARHAGDRLRRAQQLLAPKDYLRLRLTGVWGTDPTDAAGWLLYDLASGGWHSELVSFSGVRPEQLPQIQAPCSLAGNLRAELCARWNMRGEVVVAVGGGDDVAASGCGAVEPGDLYEHIGSTGSLFAVTDRVLLDEKRVLECYPTERPDRFWIGGSFNGAGTAIDRALRLSTFSRAGQIDWPRVNAALAKWPEARPQRRPLFLPYLVGERCPVWDPNIRGALVDLDVEHTPEDLAIAIYEGPALLLASIHAELSRIMSPGTRIFSAGKGAEEESFGRLRATIYGQSIARVGHCDAALLGAAFVAGVAAGTWSSIPEAAARCLEPVWLAQPVSELANDFQQRLARFQSLTQEFKQLAH